MNEDMFLSLKLLCFVNVQFLVRFCALDSKLHDCTYNTSAVRFTQRNSIAYWLTVLAISIKGGEVN